MQKYRVDVNVKPGPVTVRTVNDLNINPLLSYYNESDENGSLIYKPKNH